MITDRALRARMAEAAHERSTAYSWDAVMGELMGHYRDIMKASRPHRVIGYSRMPATQAALD